MRVNLEEVEPLSWWWYVSIENDIKPDQSYVDNTEPACREILRVVAKTKELAEAVALRTTVVPDAKIQKILKQGRIDAISCIPI